MKRTSFLPILFGFALVALQATGAGAAVCGNGVKETGEQCDHGASNGITCCKTNCDWVDTGGGCIPSAPGYDSCNQGHCQGTQHTCEPDNPPINPCVGNSCSDCVSTGPLTANFTCTGDPFADDSPCESDGLKCTIEHCVSGACTGESTAKCPEPTNSCKIATCNTGTGNCGTNNRSAGSPCYDGNPCTVSEQCSNGNCTAGIVNVSSGTACDDKNDCRTGETCNGSGACTGGTNVASGTACDDFNNCTTNNTCNGFGFCQSGGTAANGSDCVPTEPGAGAGGNTCRKLGKCNGGVCNAGEDVAAEGAACTNGNPCNAGFCSGGNCIRRNATQQSGAVEDYNSCTDSSSTTCNTAGVVSTPTCVVGTCVACANDCANAPNFELNGQPIPCACTYSQ